jgi:hypothetical protein
MEKTTIQINVDTLERLKSIKVFDRQSYDEILNNLLENLNEEILSKEEIKEIQIGLENVQKGEVYSIESVAEELGITLS